MKVDNTSPHLLQYSRYFDIQNAYTFSRVLDNNSKRKKWKPNKHDIEFHYGQRKLLLSEIEFIIDEYSKLKKDKKIILYIGASTGINSVHTYTLARLFPEFEYHLYDKNEFYPKLYALDNVKIFKKWFLEPDIQKYKNKNVFLISDLRNPLIGKYKDEENIPKMNDVIVEDMMFQKKLYESINPISALLKFRLPWNNKKTEYLDGKIYYQVWEGPQSTETRLVPNRKIISYDNKEYEEQMYYFNTETRIRYYEHSLKCYGHCYDCYSEIVILEKLIKFLNLKTKVCTMGRKITTDLSFFNDKRLFKHPPLDKYKI